MQTLKYENTHYNANIEIQTFKLKNIKNTNIKNQIKTKIQKHKHYNANIEIQKHKHYNTKLKYKNIDIKI